MILLRRFRYWLGARLLRPHVKREWEHYTRMSGDENPHGEQERINCAYITIGLVYSLAQRRRLASARKEER